MLTGFFVRKDCDNEDYSGQQYRICQDNATFTGVISDCALKRIDILRS